MKKRAKVHLLPTDRLKEIGKTLHVRGKNDTNYTPHNIYITTDDEIKEGDWYYVSGGIGASIGIYKAEKSPVNNDWRHKIIATTDPKLYNKVWRGMIEGEDWYEEEHLPQPSKEFIEEYCRAGGIDEVDVEYVTDIRGHWRDNNDEEFERPKVTSNNEIIIHLIDQEKRDCLIAFDDWFNKNWYPEQYSILAIEAYLKTIQ